jgi:hypothetical protein
MCNVLTGIFIKQFEQNNPEFDGILYNEWFILQDCIFLPLT